MRLAKIGPFLTVKSPVLLVVDQRADEVGRQQVGRELDALEAVPGSPARSVLTASVLARPGTPSSRTWPFGEQPDEQALDHVALPDDDLARSRSGARRRSRLCLDAFVDHGDLRIHGALLPGNDRPLEAAPWRRRPATRASPEIRHETRAADPARQDTTGRRWLETAVTIESSAPGGDLEALRTESVCAHRLPTGPAWDHRGHPAPARGPSWTRPGDSARMPAHRPHSRLGRAERAHPDLRAGRDRRRPMPVLARSGAARPLGLLRFHPLRRLVLAGGGRLQGRLEFRLHARGLLPPAPVGYASSAVSRSATPGMGSIRSSSSPSHPDCRSPVETPGSSRSRPRPTCSWVVSVAASAAGGRS